MKRVRFNRQTIIRPIPSYKEAETENPASTPTTQTSQALAVITEMEPAIRELPETLSKEANFQGTLNTDPKPPNRARRFLRKFFQMVTGNRAVLRARLSNPCMKICVCRCAP